MPTCLQRNLTWDQILDLFESDSTFRHLKARSV